VLELDGLNKSYGEKNLFRNIGITVGRGEKIALLGPNGVGKSTLLKAIMKVIDYTGNVEYGHNVNVAYFAQDQAEKLDVNKTVFETVDDIAKGDIRKDLRTILGTFLFSGEDTEKKVGVLSGGERTRLALCQLLLSPSNFLILDEPTNHLDIQSKDVLKQALTSYEGTFIVVSHDREFLNGLTNRIWDIENKHLKIHHFTLNEYLDYKLNKGDYQVDKNEKIKVESENVKIEKQEKKSSKSNDEKNLISKELKKIEQQIEQIEKDLLVVNQTISTLDFTTGETHIDILQKHDELNEKLSEMMANWEAKMSDLEN
jgi:ATP-binding cassette subfamily F protein 3